MVYLPRIFLEFFPKRVYSTIVAEKFQIYSVKITGTYICESKHWICSFLLMPPRKTLPQVFIIIPQAEGTAFLKIFFLSGKRGKNYGVTKIAKIKRRRVLITSCDKFHHLCIFATFKVLVYLLLCQNLASSMLKCEGSLT